MQSFLLLSLLPLLALAAPSPAELGLEKRSITCLSVGASATAKWTNSAGESCTWTGVVGSNFGTNSVNSGEYVHLIRRKITVVQTNHLVIATLATVAAVLDAQAHLLAMHIPKTASRTISAHGSTTPAVVPGKRFYDCEC
jgi:hypothetical protein